MKKYLIIILVLVSFMSCNILDVATDINFKTKLGIELHEDTPVFKTSEEIIKFLDDNITFKEELNGLDYWQSYEETILLGYGDCEDYAIAYANLLFNSLGIKSELVGVDGSKVVSISSARAIEAGGTTTHALIRYDNILIDPSERLYVEAVVTFAYSFDDLFSISQ